MKAVKQAHYAKVRTRFSESDALGHINNVSFMIYIEQARVEFVHDLEYIKDHSNDVTFILASVHCDYIRQLYIHDMIQIKTVVSRIGNKSFTLKHYIYKEESLVAEGESVLVLYDFKVQRSMPLEEQFKVELRQYLE